jgi:hypothetical protein
MLIGFCILVHWKGLNDKRTKCVALVCFTLDEEEMKPVDLINIILDVKWVDCNIIIDFLQMQNN